MDTDQPTDQDRQTDRPSDTAGHQSRMHATENLLLPNYLYPSCAFIARLPIATAGQHPRVRTTPHNG